MRIDIAFGADRDRGAGGGFKFPDRVKRSLRQRYARHTIPTFEQ